MLVWAPHHVAASLRTPLQVVPKIRVRVGISSDCSSFSGVECEDRLVLTFLFTSQLGGKGKTRRC